MTLLENNRSAMFEASFEATTYLPFLCHKSVAACQIDSYKVSDSKLRLELCNYAKFEIMESTAPSQ